MENKEKHVVNPAKKEDLIYFDTVWAKNVAHVKYRHRDKPYYLPQKCLK